MTETGAAKVVIDEKGNVSELICSVQQVLPDGFSKSLVWSQKVTDDDRKWLASAWQRWRKDAK